MNYAALADGYANDSKDTGIHATTVHQMDPLMLTIATMKGDGTVQHASLFMLLCEVLNHLFKAWKTDQLL